MWTAFGLPSVEAQQAPLVKLGQQTKVTVASTNAFQQAIAQNFGRVGCTLQYLSANTGFVFFGATAPADTTTSFQLKNGQSVSCADGGVAAAGDTVWVTGTSTDVFVVRID